MPRTTIAPVSSIVVAANRWSNIPVPHAAEWFRALNNDAGKPAFYLNFTRRSPEILNENHYVWVESAAQSGEWWLGKVGSTAGSPLQPLQIDQVNVMLEPDEMIEDGNDMTAATVGSLSNREWDWGDNDTLGFDTIYINPTPAGDPNDQVEAYFGRIDYTNEGLLVAQGAVDQHTEFCPQQVYAIAAAGGNFKYQIGS